jgi:hypothetical protein
MSEADDRNDTMEHTLRQVHPAGPTEELKEQVLSAARNAWVADIRPAPWRIVLRRTALSTAAAVLIVVLVNLWSGAVLGRWRSPGNSPVCTTSYESPDVDLPLAYDSPTCMAGMLRTPTRASGASVLDHLQRLDEALEQSELRI